MFEELDDKLELDLFNKTQPEDFVEDTTDNKYANKKKMSEVSKVILKCHNNCGALPFRGELELDWILRRKKYLYSLLLFNFFQLIKLFSSILWCKVRCDS